MQVGLRVICIDDSKRPEVSEWATKHCPNWVKKGDKYTIREFDDHDGIVDGVLLDEIINPLVFMTKWNKVIEPRFATWRFQVLQENEELEEELEEVNILDEILAL